MAQRLTRSCIFIIMTGYLFLKMQDRTARRELREEERRKNEQNIGNTFFHAGYEEYIEEIKDIWDSHWLTNMGAKHNEPGKELEKYLKVDHVSLFSNGHMALELLIQALHLTGEVITTSFTFASTTHAIVRNGLTPVFCDVNPEDYTMDVSKIEALITDKTSAIIPVHVYGNLL